MGRATRKPWKNPVCRPDPLPPVDIAVYRLGVFFLLPLLAVAPSVAAKPTDADLERTRGEVAKLVRQLDSDRFDVRQKAVSRLQELVGKPEWQNCLAEEFHRVLVRADVSFEVRWQLNRWMRQLPAGTPPVAADRLPGEQLDRLVRQLDDDRYAARVGAACRLDWLLTNPKYACPVLVRLKRALAAEGVGIEARRRLESAAEHARRAWLASDPAGWDLPPVSDEQIDGWLSDLSRPGPAGGEAAAQIRHDAAQRELYDLLPRDQYVPRLRKLVRDRLAQGPSPAAAEQLRLLSSWTKPALVVEIWSGRQKQAENYTVVGEPLVLDVPGAKPIEFDPANDRVAHCVSANVLTPGKDYPVGEAIPHPTNSNCFYYMVYLPTARSRMARLYAPEGDDAQRLAAISRRTLARVLAEKHPMNEAEVEMLSALDPGEVSRFAGKYFLLVDDRSLDPAPPRPGSPFDAPPRDGLGGRPGRFGTICRWLAVNGTKDAVPGLLEAMAKKRFLPPTRRAPFDLPWLALLSLAARDPWPETDAFLADLLGNKRSLKVRTNAPELGATAAAVLLGRHGKQPGEFDLEEVPEPHMYLMHVPGYRFAAEDGRKRVRAWWDQTKGRTKAAPPKGK
jgi:hypothetical protein